MRQVLILAAVFISATGVHGSSSQKKADQGKPIVCKLMGVSDNLDGQNAYTYFLPKGWTSESSLTWDPRQPGSYHVKVSATTPDGQYEVTQKGKEGYIFNVTYPFDGGPPMIMHTPVHHATEYLRVLLDQFAKTDGVSDVQVVDEVNAPLPAKQAALNKPVSTVLFTATAINETGFLQVKFTRGNQPMLAMLGTSFMGSVGHPVKPIGRPSGQSEGGTFSVGPTTLLIMPADAPKQKQREMQIIAGSIQITPKFQSYMAEMIDKLIRIRLGAVTEGIKYANATFHERSMAQFSQQMHMRDSYSHAFCNYVSDLQDYKDQSGHIVTAPATYRYAWSDGRGDYLLNDDPTVDLRGIGNGDWKQMQKANIGD